MLVMIDSRMTTVMSTHNVRPTAVPAQTTNRLQTADPPAPLALTLTDRSRHPRSLTVKTHCIKRQLLVSYGTKCCCVCQLCFKENMMKVMKKSADRTDRQMNLCQLQDHCVDFHQSQLCHNEVERSRLHSDTVPHCYTPV